MVGVGGRHLAIDRVGIGLHRIAGPIGQGNDGAHRVGMIVVDGIVVGDLDHADRLVDPGPVDVLPQQVTVLGIFKGERGHVSIINY